MTMMCTRFFALCSTVLCVTLALPHNNNVPDDLHPRRQVREHHQPRYAARANVDRAQSVVDTFRLAWEGYYRYAFPNDELLPVTNGFGNSRNGWGASAVDAFSTALVMEQKDIVNQILDFIPSIDWSRTATEVSLFETTIRYLGGLLSGYDLLKGPLAHLADNPAKVDTLLVQAINLANNLSYAFETPTGIPINELNFANRGKEGTTNGLATVGTLILEWTRLADLSGNKTYADLVNRAEQYLLSPSPQPVAEPFPGLLGMNIDVNNGQFLDSVGGWIGGADSFYEYLIKMYIYNPSAYGKLRDRWIVAADSTIQYLTSHPSSRPDITFIAAFRGTELRLVSQHLACFTGGNFILGGQVLGQQKYIDYGLALTSGCHETYISTASRIGPEIFSWDTTKLPLNQSAFYNASGFYITDGNYQLRPEVIESYYYAYRATSDARYQDWAWDAFVAINKTTRVGSGYSSISDVNAVDGGNKTDFQESFWFAEVLKYSYLIQTNGQEEWQVGKDGTNKWVYNTEAHPVKVTGR